MNKYLTEKIIYFLNLIYTKIRIEISTDKRSYKHNEPIKITATITGGLDLPLKNPKLTFVIKKPNGKIEKLSPEIAGGGCSAGSGGVGGCTLTFTGTYKNTNDIIYSYYKNRIIPGSYYVITAEVTNLPGVMIPRKLVWVGFNREKLDRLVFDIKK